MISYVLSGTLNLTNQLTLPTGAHTGTAGLHGGVRPISVVFV